MGEYLPIVKWIEASRMALDKLIDVLGRENIEAVLVLLAMNVEIPAYEATNECTTLEHKTYSTYHQSTFMRIVFFKLGKVSIMYCSISNNFLISFQNLIGSFFPSIIFLDATLQSFIFGSIIRLQDSIFYRINIRWITIESLFLEKIFLITHI